MVSEATSVVMELRSVRVNRRRGVVFAALVILCWPAITRVAAADQAADTQPADLVVVADFGTSVRTAHGGWFYVVGGRPDVIRDRLVRLGDPPAQAWRMDVLPGAPAKAVGAVIPLFDNLSGSAAKPVDIRAAPLLELRLSGELKQRRLRVEVCRSCVDDAEAPGTTIVTIEAGAIGPERWVAYAPRAVTRDAPPQVGAIRLWLEGEGPAWVAVDGLQFVAAEQEVQWAAADPPRRHPLRKAMWVWTTAEIWPDAARQKELIDFARKHGFTDLYCQIAYTYQDGQVALKLLDGQRALNQAAHGEKIKVHALDGDPHYVLPEQQERMLKLVAALDEFNKASPADGRYDAVHLDNEPYLLPEWKDPAARQKVMASFVTLNEELRRRTNAAGMDFGIDIPFWFDLKTPAGEPEFAVEEGGAKVPLLEALFRSAQNVGIMSYRERVIGPNGVVAVCQTEFALGARLGVDVFASVELGTGPQVERGITLGVYPADYLREQLETLEQVLAYERGCRGLAIHNYDCYKAMEERR